MRTGLSMIGALALVGCAAGGSGEPGLPGLGSPGHASATGWDGVDSDSDGDDSDDASTSDDAQVDEATSDTGDGDGDGDDDAGDADDNGSDSSDDGAEESSSDDGPAGDPECVPGFAVAFDITDGSTDDLPSSCAWFADALLSESDRVSLEWWGTDGQHFGPTVFDLSGHDSLIADYGDCFGATGHVTSEDGQWWMTLVPGDSYVFLTAAGDDIQTGAVHLYGWLANEHVGNDEIMGIDFGSLGEAWGAKDTSGDRVLACAEL